MNKSFLIALALGAVLTSCDHRSDLRASEKVSVDQVPPGTRDTDISNLGGRNSDATPESGYGEHGHEGGNKATDATRPDVMPNHDEHSSQLGGKSEQVPQGEKTNSAESVENHK